MSNQSGINSPHNACCYREHCRKLEAEIDGLRGELDIVTKLLCGEPILDVDIEKHWNPLHSTLASRLNK